MWIGNLETQVRFLAAWLVILRRWKLLHLSKKGNKSLVKICWQLKIPTRTWERTRCTMQMKNRFWLWLSILWETLKLTRYQSKKFSFITFLYRTKAKAHAFILCEQILFIPCSFSARNWSLVVDPEKLIFSISSEHKTTYKGPGSYPLDLIPCIIPCHRCEKSARDPRHSHHLIGQRDNIHARTTVICVDPRGYITSEWPNLF